MTPQKKIVMKNLQYPIYTLFLLSLVVGCQADQSVEDPLTINERDILPHIEELSSDAYLGRMPFTAGDQKTVAYLSKQVESIGLQPGNEGSYTQSVPMVEITSTPVGGMTVKTPAGSLKYVFGDDYVIHCPKTVNEVTVDDAELVFCGYGIVDEKLGWNDFAGVDLTDKIAVVLVNDPGFGGEDSTFFKGDIMTYYGRWTYKYEEADRQGARGLLIIHETTTAGYPWFVVQQGWTGPQLALDDASVTQGADVKGWIHLERAKELFEKCGLDLGQQIRSARKPGFKPVSLNATVSTGLTNTFKRDKSDNVVALLQGSTRPEEYVLYSAHWDHLGVGQAVEGDSIYNGALDNASGTGTLLGLAKRFAEQQSKPERSIIFLWVTAEEQGLLGSSYYARNPTFPIDKTVANINIDGCNPHGEMKDFQIVGYGQSEMDQIAAEELAKQGRYVLPDQEPEKGYFFRSDHFNFVKEGVPALFGEGGFDHIEKGKEYGRQKKDEYTAQNYHSPSDEFDAATWDMSGVVQDAQVYYNIGWRLSNSDEWPQWNADSEFGRPGSAVD